jgi:predicted amidohydrolase
MLRALADQSQRGGHEGVEVAGLPARHQVAVDHHGLVEHLGAHGAQVAHQFGLTTVIDTGVHPDPLVRANNGTPRTLAVDGHLIDHHFDAAVTIVEQVLRAGFWPDTISTDWNVTSKTTGVVDLPNCLSKYLGYGMSVSDVVACATVSAARTFDVFRDRGTLNVGAPADVAILELRQGSFEFVDNYKNVRIGRQRLFPSGTVLGGTRIPRP